MKKAISVVFTLMIIQFQAQKIEEKEALEFHNKVRNDVGVSPLSWSSEISKYSQEWADYLAENGCHLKHRSPTDIKTKRYGENIGWSSSSNYTLLDASKAWQSEISSFKNEILTDENWYKAGHYSQMVWRNTTQIGMGIAKCTDSSIIVVANYNPPGNYMGQKAY
jgi:uncharacterized protein YkwD